MGVILEYIMGLIDGNENKNNSKDNKNVCAKNVLPQNTSKIN